MKKKLKRLRMIIIIQYKIKIINNSIAYAKKKKDSNNCTTFFKKLVQIAGYKFLSVNLRNLKNIKKNWKKNNYIVSKQSNIKNF